MTLASWQAAAQAAAKEVEDRAMLEAKINPNPEHNPEPKPNCNPYPNVTNFTTITKVYP